mgnify:FL=1
MGISVEDFYVTKTETTGAHTGGWIEIAEVFNVHLKNINAQNMDSTISAAGLIKTSSVGPDYLTIENVYEADTGGTASLDIRADKLIVKNSN